MLKIIRAILFINLIVCSFNLIVHISEEFKIISTHLQFGAHFVQQAIRFDLISSDLMGIIGCIIFLYALNQNIIDKIKEMIHHKLYSIREIDCTSKTNEEINQEVNSIAEYKTNLTPKIFTKIIYFICFGIMTISVLNKIFDILRDYIEHRPMSGDIVAMAFVIIFITSVLLFVKHLNNDFIWEVRPKIKLKYSDYDYCTNVTIKMFAKLKNIGTMNLTEEQLNDIVNDIKNNNRLT